MQRNLANKYRGQYTSLYEIKTLMTHNFEDPEDIWMCSILFQKVNYLFVFLYFIGQGHCSEVWVCQCVLKCVILLHTENLVTTGVVKAIST